MERPNAWKDYEEEELRQVRETGDDYREMLSACKTEREWNRALIARLEKAGYHIVFHVHDEVILEVPYGQGSLEEACQIMGFPPAWASDLPLRADGDELTYYRKM